MRNPFLLVLFFISQFAFAQQYPFKKDSIFTYDSLVYERVKIDYNIYGRGDTTLLFIHGWNIDQTYWANQVSSFSTRFKVVTLDLAGHGKSGKDRKYWTVEAFSKDIAEIIRKENLQKIVLIAHSMGGEIALEVNTQVPGKIISIVGVDVYKDLTFRVNEEFKTGFTEWINHFYNHYPDEAEKFVRENLFPPTATNKYMKRVIEDYRKADPAVALPIFINLIPKYTQTADKLKNLPFVVNLMMSDYSPYKEEPLKQACMRGYKIIKIKDSGHFPMIEQPGQFNAALDAFIKAL
jgi:sigma-B regulation protein RsbQ